MVLAWLRGPVDGEVASPHSEGACCRTDRDGNGNLIHDRCVIDPDWTLRKALDHGRYTDSDARFNAPPTAWCDKCAGYQAGCIFCHTALQLIYGSVSQRREALAVLQHAGFTPEEVLEIVDPPPGKGGREGQTGTVSI